MSRFNKKGFKTVMARKTDGSLAPMPVPVKGKVAGIQEYRAKKAKKLLKKQQQEYKARLKEAKKKVPLAERSKINISKFPEQYL